MPVTDAHRHGVIDPMTGSLLRVPGTGNLLIARGLPAHTPMFDGRMRYNLQLAYKRMEVKAERATRARWWSARSISRRSPATSRIATAIKYLAAQRDMEVWLAPIAGTRVLVPYRFRSRPRSASA